MIRLVTACAALLVVFILPPGATSLTLNCVRVKEVAPGGKINYLCEVRK